MQEHKQRLSVPALMACQVMESKRPLAMLPESCRPKEAVSEVLRTRAYEVFRPCWGFALSSASALLFFFLSVLKCSCA